VRFAFWLIQLNDIAKVCRFVLILLLYIRLIRQLHVYYVAKIGLGGFERVEVLHDALFSSASAPADKWCRVNFISVSAESHAWDDSTAVTVQCVKCCCFVKHQINSPNIASVCHFSVTDSWQETTLACHTCRQTSGTFTERSGNHEIAHTQKLEILTLQRPEQLVQLD